jgi:hypothetical protein
MRRVLKITALALGVVLWIGQVANCNTITISDESQNLSTGVFVYSISLDGSTVLNAGDGFVLYDYPVVPASMVVSITLPAGDSFNEMTTATGNDINAPAPSSPAGFNQLDAENVLNGGHDSPFSPNLNFVFSGPTYTVGAGNTVLGTLTITLGVSPADLAGLNPNAVVASKDSGGSAHQQLFGSNITDPVVVAMPATVWSGCALFGALLVGGVIKKIRFSPVFE